MRLFFIITLMLALAGCGTKKENADPVNASNAQAERDLETVTAKGYGDSRDSAIEDAKSEALRQFGYRLAAKDGSPELVHAGRIAGFEVLDQLTEKLENVTFWEIKIRAEIEKQ